jgi:hypothetical protein
MKALFRRMLALVRRASDRLRVALLVGLLAVVYALLIPWFSLGYRLFGKRTRGWRPRVDLDACSLERLRQPF